MNDAYNAPMNAAELFSLFETNRDAFDERIGDWCRKHEDAVGVYSNTADYVDDECFDVLDAERDGDEICVKLLVTFRELVSFGCRDVTMPRNHSKRMTLTLRRRDDLGPHNAGEPDIGVEEDDDLPERSRFE